MVRAKMMKRVNRMVQTSLKVPGVAISEAQQASCPAIGAMVIPSALTSRPNRMEKPTMTSR